MKEMILPEPIETGKQEITHEAAVIEVVSNESMVKACNLLKGIRGIVEQINETFDPAIASAYKTHRDVIAAKKRHSFPLDEASKTLRQKIGTYEQEQERLRMKKERELQRQAQEREEKIALEEAAMLESEGRKEEAEQILDGPIEASPVIVKNEVPKVSGVSTRYIWKFKIVDEKKIPREYLTPDEKSIGAIVRARQGKVEIPGVKAYREAVVSARRL